MRHALDSTQMRAAEDAAVASGAVSVELLMDRAGSALADEVGRRVPGGPVVAVCGPGNNGGDGWVAARLLGERGRDVAVLALRAPDDLDGPARRAGEAAVASGVVWSDCRTDADAQDILADAAVIIDAVFGFGLSDAVREPYAGWIRRINEASAAVVSADVPSGLDSDTGRAGGVAVRSDITVTFSALKTGLVVGSGPDYAGQVVVADIGIDEHVGMAEGALEIPGAADVRRMVPWPARCDHKGSRGRVALVAGSDAYPGAAVLAAAGALRMGAGYVHVVAPERVCDLVLGSWPSTIVHPIAGRPEVPDSGAAEVLDAIGDADAVVVGPGIGRSGDASAMVHALLDSYGGPLLLDADALNLLVGELACLRDRTAPTLITPHPGEAARLLGVTIEDVERDRPGAARALCGSSLVCVLKGPETIIAGGGRISLVRTGGPELARAGTGDVLAGMLGTLLAQGCRPHDAAVAAAYIHGRAGAIGAARYTATGHVASDLPGSIPDAVRELAGG